MERNNRNKEKGVVKLTKGRKVGKPKRTSEKSKEKERIGRSDSCANMLGLEPKIGYTPKETDKSPTELQQFCLQ